MQHTIPFLAYSLILFGVGLLAILVFDMIRERQRERRAAATWKAREEALRADEQAARKEYLDARREYLEALREYTGTLKSKHHYRRPN